VSSDIQCVSPTGNICGEGAVWNPDEAALYWADINRFVIHKYSTHSSATESWLPTRSWLFDEPVVSVNLTTDSQLFLLVFATRIALWSPLHHPKTNTIYRLPTAPSMRFNDAKVDPRGSLWVGSMRNNVGPEGENLDVEFTDGVLYRIDPDGRATEWMDGIGISNTLAWSPDQSIFYFGDTIANALYAFAYDRKTGAISERRPFLTGYPHGLPDGSAMDSEGCLWNTRPYAGSLIRISPDGSIDRVVSLPFSKPTTCAFGGEDMRILFITSAHSEHRLSGALFALQTSTPGLPIQRFRVAEDHSASTPQ
jgi:sugar lactone lactonase YvrE